MSPRRVLLHVGTPKTGTSYLQDVLFGNRDLLEHHGILYPAERFDEHFLAALDLMRLPWGGLERQAVGAWDRLAERTRGFDGDTVIISHEIFARASRRQVQKALTSLGHPDTEIHVLISARDLVRQIPAEWQENIKHRRRFSYQAFLERIQDPERVTKLGAWFWGVQEVPAILDRWASGLPPEQVHIVTVPAPGAAKTELWDRFSRAFGLDDVPLDLHAERANPSMGVPETALLRRINRAVVKDLEPDDYRPFVRELLAHRTLAERKRSARLSLPPDVYSWAHDLSEQWVGEIERRRYDVIGDLADLIPQSPSTKYVNPDRPNERAVANAGVAAIRALLLETSALRRERDRLQRENDRLRGDLGRLDSDALQRVKRRARRELSRNAVGRTALRGYRRTRTGAARFARERGYRLARGRSSRSA